MHPSYLDIWDDLFHIDTSVKMASLNDNEIALNAMALKTAQTDQVYGKIRAASRADSSRGKEAAVNAFLDTVRSLRTSHVEVGQKIAASQETALDLFTKLAAAVFVDEVILGAGTLTKEAKLTQLLGREYAIELVRELLA